MSERSGALTGVEYSCVLWVHASLARLPRAPDVIEQSERLRTVAQAGKDQAHAVLDALDVMALVRTLIRAANAFHLSGEEEAARQAIRLADICASRERRARPRAARAAT